MVKSYPIDFVCQLKTGVLIVISSQEIEPSLSHLVFQQDFVEVIPNHVGSVNPIKLANSARLTKYEKRDTSCYDRRGCGDNVCYHRDLSPKHLPMSRQDRRQGPDQESTGTNRCETRTEREH